MKSNLQFLKKVGCFTLLAAGLLTVAIKGIFGTDIIEHSLEISAAYKDHCKTHYQCSGRHPAGCCSICLKKGEQ